MIKNIILTGASEGLGREIGLKAIENNINVIALCRKKPDYECIHISTDLSNDESISESCKFIKENHKDFGALINCAGIPGIESLDNLSYECLEEVMKVNTLAPIYLVSNLINEIKSNTCDIINIGSTIGLKQGYENQIAYTTSKWALRGASYNLQLEFKNTSVRTMQINVGGMNTKMHEKYTGIKIENSAEWMDPSDISDMIFYFINLPKKIEISEITINRKFIK